MAKFQEIIKQIYEAKYAPVYFLQGEEPFFIDNIIDHLETQVLDDSQKSFNQYVFYGKETDFPTILGTARKYPMMGERQVVIVKEAQEMRDWTRDDKQTLLTSYLENPTPSTILAFGYKYKTLDKRTRLSKELEKYAVVLTSKKIYDNQLPGWIQEYARARNVSLTQGAIMMLSENIGINLQRQANEIEKLLINIDEGTEINEEAVYKYVGISKDYNVFELQKALSFGDFGKALKIVNYFSANPSNHPMVLVLANLFSYYTKILKIYQLPQKDKNMVMKAIGLNAYVAGEYLTALKHYSAEHVVYNLQLIHRADLQSKGIGYNMGKEKEKGFLRELIYNLMHFEAQVSHSK